MAEVWTLSGGKEKKAKLLLQHKLVEKQTFWSTLFWNFISKDTNRRKDTIDLVR
jgi:hypothetical protein